MTRRATSSRRWTPIPSQLYNKTPKVKYEYTYDAEGNVLTEFQRDSDATETSKAVPPLPMTR